MVGSARRWHQGVKCLQSFYHLYAAERRHLRRQAAPWGDKPFEVMNSAFLGFHTPHRVNGCTSGYGFRMHRAFNFPKTCDFANRNCGLVNPCGIPLQKQPSSAEERILQSVNLSLHATSYALINSRYTPPCSRAQRRLVADVETSAPQCVKHNKWNAVEFALLCVFC
jgi:hypothetical protein